MVEFRIAEAALLPPPPLPLPLIVELAVALLLVVVLAVLFISLDISLLDEEEEEDEFVVEDAELLAVFKSLTTTDDGNETEFIGD